jgi:hypothetical protein
MADIFISYSRKDKDFVRHLDEAGISHFIRKEEAPVSAQMVTFSVSLMRVT